MKRYRKKVTPTTIKHERWSVRCTFHLFQEMMPISVQQAIVAKYVSGTRKLFKNTFAHEL